MTDSCSSYPLHKAQRALEGWATVDGGLATVADGRRKLPFKSKLLWEVSLFVQHVNNSQLLSDYASLAPS